ncbi:MAG: hypothetical protein GXY01_09055 [Clostridiales bacterium]|jgi:flagellar hook-associated protein 3 FlgL|nr:hypothetical protein [Clostridiales bacterium]
MRVSDKTTVRNYLKYLEQAKTNYAETNARIASGNRFVRISYDVSAGTRVLRTRTDLSKTQEYYDNVKSINDGLSVTEDALKSINDILSDVQSKKITKAMSDSTGEAGRKALANEVKALKEEILQFANTKYGNKYVLGGSSAKIAPFSVGTDGKLLYNGIDVNNIIYDNTDGRYYDKLTNKLVPMDSDIYADIGLGLRMVGSDIESDTAFKVSYSGLEILGFGENSDGMPNNIFNMLTNIEKCMRDGDMETLGKYGDILIETTDSFRALLTDIGAKTNFLDTVEARINSNIDSYKNQLNNLMGINDAEEAKNQTMNDYVLKAVLQMGSKILPVTLMDFLN